MRYSIGVDLGGTDIKAGLVSSVGDISCRVVVPTDVETGGPKVVAARIAKAVHRVLVEAENEDICLTSASAPRQLPVPNKVREIGVGLGAPGLIIAETGVVHFSPNFPGWSDIPLVTYVNAELAKLDTPAHAPRKKSKPILRGMDNDVNAMTLGELHHGAGTGCKSLVALTLGTGCRRWGCYQR